MRSPSIPAFDVLGAFNHSQRVLTLSEIARRSHLQKSTVHRVLAMLVELDAVERVDHGYRVGLRLFALGSVSVDKQLRDAALPLLERLRLLTHATVNLAILRGSDVVYLEKLTSRRSPSTPALVGGMLPARRTAVGKAMIAFGNEMALDVVDRAPAVRIGYSVADLHPDDRMPRQLDEIRRRGFATDREESAHGLACVGAPVVVGDRAVAGISVAFASSEGSGETLVNPVVECATALSRVISRSPELYL